MTLVIWDSVGSPPEEFGKVLTWNGYREGPRIGSLLRRTEDLGQGLRDQFLAWIHDLGDFRFDGQRVIDHFQLEDGDLSLWWVSSLAQKHVWRSPAIVDVLRIMTVEHILRSEGVDAVLLVTQNKDLQDSLRALCTELGVDLEIRDSTDSSTPVWVKRWPRAGSLQLVQLLRVFFGEIRRRGPLSISRSGDWFEGSRSVFVCSNFLNLDRTEAEQGRFRSHYWGRLHEVFDDLEVTVNWLHLFMSSPAVPTAGEARGLGARFNRLPNREGAHAFHDSYLSPGVLAAVALRWLRLSLRRLFFRDLGRALSERGPSRWLWPLVRADWRGSFRAASLLPTLINIELFDRALGSMPTQRLGLFLAEGRPEERALIQAWKKHGHGQIVAVVHATVSFWDLRYHFDHRVLNDESPAGMPLADLTAVNGPVALEAHKKSGYPANRIIELEALRYEYLFDESRRLSAQDPASPIKVLVIGEYRLEPTLAMLHLVVDATRSVGPGVDCVFKPHPNVTVVPEEHPGIHLEVVDQPLGEIFGLVDVVVASSGSSAVVDAYLFGLPVVVYRVPEELPLVDLIGEEGVVAVGSSAEMEEALVELRHFKRGKFRGSADFFAGPGLDRWRDLISFG